MISLFMFFLIIVLLLFGFPAAFTLSGTATLFAIGGILSGHFDASILGAIPSRVFGIINNKILYAVPLFVFMGVALEKTRVAEELLLVMDELFERVPNGLAVAVMIVGGLLAASTGIVGATVITMGLIALPTMLKKQLSPELSTGAICAAGSLGQIIPPSIVLVILGDVISNAYQQTQLSQGIFSPETVSITEIFAGALLPGMMLVGMYISYIMLITLITPPTAIPTKEIIDPQQKSLAIRCLKCLFPPLFLIVLVLGTILFGIATPTEAASVGAVGALIIAISQKSLSFSVIKEICRTTTFINCMIFTILIGASLFSLVMRGFGGDEVIRDLFLQLPGGKYTALLIIMTIIFLLGFVLDLIEITFVVIPIIGPILLTFGFDPIWLAVMLGLNLQTSFLTPPLGFALFYLRGVAPPEVKTSQIYRGVIPFVIIQLLAMVVLTVFPKLATWLPQYLESVHW